MPKSEYNTRQRELIVSFLRNHQQDHVHASDIMDHLSVGDSPVGVATVYRTLDRLSKAGTIRRYLDGSGGACFQYVTASGDEHFHLKCTACGKLIHLEDGCLSESDKLIRETYRFAIDPRQTVLYGLCDECGDKDKTDKN